MLIKAMRKKRERERERVVDDSFCVALLFEKAIVLYVILISIGVEDWEGKEEK